MGLGWATDKEGRAGLSGATYGYRSYLYVDPVRRLAVVVLMNYSEGDATALGLRLRETATQRRPGK
jgi:CubicO group peptidase (beta-lactamase class C family)